MSFKLNLLLLFVFMGLAFAQVPTASINPIPVFNMSSNLLCGLNSNATTTNITATLYDGNNTQLSFFNGIYPTNKDNVLGNYTFNFTGYTYLICNFDGSINQYSPNYLIASTFWGNDTTNDLFNATLITLSVLAFVFAYLHVNSNNYLWANMWFFMACLMILANIMGIVGYAQDKGAKGIEGIGLALFIGFVWIFILSMIIFVWDTVYRLFILALRWLKGEKED